MAFRTIRPSDLAWIAPPEDEHAELFDSAV
jgi:hypothetical protein